MSGNDRGAGDLSLDRFEAALDRFGSRIEAWPREEQAEARRLVEASPQARQWLQTAERVDEALALLIMPESPSQSSSVIDGQILFGRPRVSAGSGAPARVNVRRLAAWGSAVLAASLLVGFVAGASLAAPDDDDGAAYTMLDADAGNIL